MSQASDLRFQQMHFKGIKGLFSLKAVGESLKCPELHHGQLQERERPASEVHDKMISNGLNLGSGPNLEIPVSYQ